MRLKKRRIQKDFMKKKRVGKRGRAGWRKRNPRCTICTEIRWMGNIKDRQPFSLLKQIEKEREESY